MEGYENSVDFPLYEHQLEAVNGVDDIYSDNRRLAGVKLPTGGGKSFVAMQEILRAGGNNYADKKPDDKDINLAEILYVAPTNEILFQIQCNIAEFILKKDVDSMSKEEIKEAVKRAFPNLKLKCYATLISEMKQDREGKKVSRERLKDYDPDLVILDEAHRSGATESQQAVAELLGCDIENGELKYNPNSKKKSKVLAISATPERDVDGKNMMDLWAKALDNLSQERIDNKDHIGKDLDLDTAVRNGIVIQPEVIHFDGNLVDTPDYRRMVAAYASPAKQSVKRAIRQRLDEINTEIFGIPNFDQLSPEEQLELKTRKNLQTMVEAIKAGKIPEGGKMIMFIPHYTGDEKEKDYDKFFAEKKEFIEKMLAESGLEPLRIDVLSSKYTEEQNTDRLDLFNKPTGTLTEQEEKEGKEPPKFNIIIASDKLNEGIHAKGITNSFMLRSVQEGENTNQRAQTILFLQQIGRTVFTIKPGSTPPKRPVIFDYAGNFYTQNRDNPRENKIEIFELTPIQEKLLKASRLSVREVTEGKSTISAKLPRLMETLKVLRQYTFGPNNEAFVPTEDLLDSSMTLEKLLDTPPYNSRKEEIIANLEDMGLYSSRAGYKIGADYVSAIDAFWKDTKCFEEFDLSELIENGIIDSTSKAGKERLYKLEEKGYVDLATGFIKAAAPKKFREMNIYTGTNLGKDGLNINGIDPSRYDLETGLDEDNYDIYGFNPEGKHKKTGTIHDEKGFQADGINILTGTEYDLLGYNRDGICPMRVTRAAFERVQAELAEAKTKAQRDKVAYTKEELVFKDNEDSVIIGGWDRDNFWHAAELTENGEVIEYSKSLTKYTEGTKPKFDRYGYPSVNKIGQYNVYTNPPKMLADDGIDRDGSYLGRLYEASPNRKFRKMLYQRVYGREIWVDRDNFSKDDGFSIGGVTNNGRVIPSGVHKETGTRFDPQGRPVSFFSEKGLAVGKNITKEIIKNFGIENFDEHGISTITGDIEDIYGFTALDYKAAKLGRTPRNAFGKTIADIPKTVVDKDIRSLYTKKDIRSGPNRGKLFFINVLGTDKAGKLENGEMHPAMGIAEKYVESCIKNGMPLEEFKIKIAREEKMLVIEADRHIRTSLNQAAVLMRICPELARSEKCQKLTKLFNNATSEQKKEFFDLCPGLEDSLRKDLEIAIRERAIAQKELVAKEKNPKLQKEAEILRKRRNYMYAKLKGIEQAIDFDENSGGDGNGR